MSIASVIIICSLGATVCRVFTAQKEALPAFTAYIGFLYDVNPFVGQKVALAEEGLPALVALERFLPRVDFLVSVKVFLLREAFAAL